MKAKKNEKPQLEKNSGLYFVIGLSLVLALTYLALEWKSFDDATTCVITYIDDPGPFIEDVPFIKPTEPPTPKPIINPPILEIIDDHDEVDFKDIFMEPTITDCSVEVGYIEPEEPEEINITVVEEKPIFPGCEGSFDKYACFQEMMQKHIRKNFKYPESAVNMGQEGKVYVQFTIQKDGSIDGIRLRGPYKLLEDEAKRIISKLPKMTPGKQRGTPVKVPFSIPISFVLQ